MATATLVKSNNGFNILNDGIIGKWSIRICSTVNIGERDTKSAYYILISENGVVNSSVSAVSGEPTLNISRDSYVLPVYVKDLVFDILSSGSINDYLVDGNINNEFTRAKHIS